MADVMHKGRSQAAKVYKLTMTVKYSSSDCSSIHREVYGLPSVKSCMKAVERYTKSCQGIEVTIERVEIERMTLDELKKDGDYIGSI